MKKLSALIMVIVTLLLCGCAQPASASTASDALDSDAPFSYPEEQIPEEDLAIPDVALEWQSRNAPIYFDEKFFDRYSYQVGDYYYLDLDQALASIEIEAEYDVYENIITIHPKQELGPIMFQFTLFCENLPDIQPAVCYEYLYEFMHTNSNSEEWLCEFSESEMPDVNTAFYFVRIDGCEFLFTDNVMMEVDTTIATMLTIGNEEMAPEEFDDLEFFESPTFEL